MTTKRIIVWTAPRCVSTAFERSLMNLDNTKTFHEPFSLPYYFGEERKSARYLNDPPTPGMTYHSVVSMLQKDYDGIDLVVSKDMAYYIEDCFDILLDEGFKDIQHTFLIRNPKEAIPSLYKASTNPKLGWDYFEPKEAGFIQLFSLYNFVRAKLDPSPVIIDAGELLESPEETMRRFCESVGIKYKPGMTEWEPGPVDGWDVCAAWHEDVLKSPGLTEHDDGPSHISKMRIAWHTDLIKSSGFSRKSATDKPRELETLPAIVTNAIEDSLPAYEKMFQNRSKPVSTRVWVLDC